MKARAQGDSFVEYSGEYKTRVGTIQNAQWLPHANKYVYTVKFKNETVEGYDFDAREVIHLA